MGFKWTTEEFILRAKKVHGDKFNYSKVDYKGIGTRIIVMCPDHGEFYPLPSNHLHDKGCRKCCGLAKSNTAEFIEKAKRVHEDKYDYSQVAYRTARAPVNIVCSLHGKFAQKPNNHLSGEGCRQCGNISKTLTINEFIERAKKIHGDKFDYRKAEYKHNTLPVNIICPTHGQFTQTADDHLQGRGCTSCSESHGERKIATTLDALKVPFQREYRFSTCRNINRLPFDFFFEIDNSRFCIEYQGEQHYRAIDYWGGEKTLNRINKNDKIKKEWCKKNEVFLLIVPYLNYDQIDEIVAKFIKQPCGDTI